MSSATWDTNSIESQVFAGTRKQEEPLATVRCLNWFVQFYFLLTVPVGFKERPSGCSPGYTGTFHNEIANLSRGEN